MIPKEVQGIEKDDPAFWEVLSGYFRAQEYGQAIDLERFVREHAEYEQQLRDFFSNKHLVDGFAKRAVSVSAIEDQNGTVMIPPKSATQLDTPTLDSAARIEASPRLESHPRYFGDYELIEEIARGGMGVVFRARQVKLNRIVALKMILSGQLASKEDVQRFYTEAESAAGLDHPGIVPVFEVGEHNGQHFFSMGYVEGRSLASVIADGPLPPREAAELVRKVAVALQYAHDRGVIHRDIKPANILLQLDKQSHETMHDVSTYNRRIASNLQPKITDFGLAKRTSADSNLTGTGQILGTPSYMPPEQAQGRIAEVCETADLYSLGAILYATLTGRPPFQADNSLSTLLQVIKQEPVSPRTLNDKIPKDLETIALKCLAKDRHQRYPSGQALGDDLGRFLDGETILARPARLHERVVKWSRRHPATAGLVGVSLLTLLMLSGGGLYFVNRLAKERNDAIEARNHASLARNSEIMQREKAEKALRDEAIARMNESAARRTVLEKLVDTNVLMGLAADGQNDPPAAVLWFANAASLASDDEVRRRVNLTRVRTWLRRCFVPIHWIDAQRDLVGLQLHPTGGFWITTTTANRCVVWDVNSELALPLPISGDLNAALWNHAGDQLATASSDGMIRLFSFPALEKVAELVGPSEASAFCYSLDDRFLAVGGMTAQVMDIAAGNWVTPPLAHPKAIAGLTFSPDGRFLVTSCYDQRMRMFALDGEEEKSEPVYSAVRQSVPNLRLKAQGPSENSNRQSGRLSLPVFINGGDELLVMTRRVIRAVP